MGRLHSQLVGPVDASQDACGDDQQPHHVPADQHPEDRHPAICLFLTVPSMIRIPDTFLLSSDDPHLDFIGQHNKEEAMEKVDEFDELCRDSRELLACCWGNSPQEG